MNQPVMVFQHGLTGDASQPAEVFPAGAGWRCLTPECRGHGAAPAGPPDELSIATFASDLAAFIEAHEPPPVVLGGISMGAAISLRLAVLRPELVRALVLARPAWLDASAPPNLAASAFAGGLLRRYSPAEALERFEASPIARRLAAEFPDNFASLRSCFSSPRIETTAELLGRISTDGPGVTCAQIAAIRVPTLVLGTAQDFVHPLPMARELAGLITGARFVEITAKSEDRARHVDEFRAALAGFLNSL